MDMKPLFFAKAIPALFLGASSVAYADSPENAKRAYITGWDQLTSKSHTSDGMERSRDGKPRWPGAIGAQAVSHNGYQYVVFYSGRDRSIPREEAVSYVVVSRRKLGGFSWEHSVLEGYEVKSDDAHNRQTIAVSEGDGRIHISFDHHNRPKMNYAATAVGVADDPASVTWDNSVFKYAENLGRDPDERLDVTYPEFNAFPGGNLIVYFRSGGSYGGEMRLAKYDAASGQWGAVANVSSRHGTFEGRETTRGPYLASGMQIGKNGSLHASWIFREKPCDFSTASRSETFCNHGLFYAKSLDEGRTWLRADGTKIADTAKGEAISIDNIGGPVVEVPKNLGPSNPGITSTVDPKTGDVHVLLRHLPSPGANESFYFHYLGKPDGSWSKEETNFTGSSTSLTMVGDRLFAFVGRDKGEIYYAERDNNFRKWKRMNIEIEGKRKFDPQGGFITWDLSTVDEGKVTLLWHRAPEKRGVSSPLQIFDIAFE